MIYDVKNERKLKHVNILIEYMNYKDLYLREKEGGNIRELSLATYVIACRGRYIFGCASSVHSEVKEINF